MVDAAPQFSQPYFVVEPGEAKSLHCVGKETGDASSEMC